MRIACFTSLTCAYLPRARVLAQTLRAVHPDWTLSAVLVDRPPAAAETGFHEVVLAEELAIPAFSSWMFRHDLVEACTAVKGRMLLRLLEREVDAVIYLDPDIAIFHGLHAALDALEKASIVLTPHLLAPNADAGAIADNEGVTLRYGVYNLGFLGVRADAAGRAFARWWAERLDGACYDAPEAGLFTDQKYCDLVPGLFERVHVLRDPGSNVASWNLSRRRLQFDRAGGLSANGAPLGFYHFSKVGDVGDVMIETYAGANPTALELLAWYRRQLRRQREPAWEAAPWQYGRYADTMPIPRADRLRYRGDPGLMARFADPFASGPGSLQEFFAPQNQTGT